jgi:very-short-patch-repair endonuclease
VVTTKPDWACIREHYRRATLAIYEAGAHQFGTDAHDWQQAGIQLTPIESMMWHGILKAGLVMYPQYPVDRFFVDFANPVSRVAIECDSDRWHDDVSDAARDASLHAAGWRVFRIRGMNCADPEHIVEFLEKVRRCIDARPRSV